MNAVAILGTMIVGFLPSLIVAWLVVGGMRRWAVKLKLMDYPGERKVHTAVVPRGGGVGIWAGVITSLALGTAAVLILGATPHWSAWLPEVLGKHLPGMQSKMAQAWMIAACATALMLLGLTDDRWGVRWWIRLMVEFGVAGMCVYGLGLQLTAFIPYPWLTGLLSVLWIVALVNSLNMLDNMDGLSAGVGLITSSLLVLMLLGGGASAEPQIFVALMMAMLMGALVGFLKYNWPPAKIFMGDSGSYFVGFWIACGTLLATYSDYQAGRPHAVLAPAIIMAIPLYDMISVILIRVCEGRSPFDGDARHFSHRLVSLGMTKRQAVLTIYLATGACSVGALLLPRVDGFGAMLILVGTLLILGLIHVLENVGRG